MTQYDYFVVGFEIPENSSDTVSEKITVEKLPFTTDVYGIARIESGKAYPVMANYLSKSDVEDSAIGAVLEQLEALPYGAKHAYAVGRNGRILIEQI